jgi:regulator of protease activity HflC (stomatin/prohibitin superfamily)
MNDDEYDFQPLLRSNLSDRQNKTPASSSSDVTGSFRQASSTRRNHHLRGFHGTNSSNRRRTQKKADRRYENDRSAINLNQAHYNGGAANGPIKMQKTCNGCCCVQCVRTNEVAIVSECGRFYNIRRGGLLCLPTWPFLCVEKRLTLRVQQLDLTCESKTKDNVFVTLQIAVLYKVDNPYKAYYSLTNPAIQIQSFIYDQVRSTIPSLDIDDLYTSSSSQDNDISLDILRALQFFMVAQFGYDIINVLILNIYPSDVKVRNAMNEISYCRRMKETMVHRGEAEKIGKVKMAEAHSEAMYLHGIGTSRQRQVLADGIRQAVDSFSYHSDIKVSHIVQRKDVMDLLLVTQYYDTLLAVSNEKGKGGNDDGGNSGIGVAMLLH